MKYNKKLIASLLTATLCAGTVAFAAPMTRNLAVNYNVKLNVNGSDFTVADQNQRPFKTNDGRTYVSIASLNAMGIATATFADNTVTIKGASGGSSIGGSAELQTQISALMAQNNSLLTTNNNLQTENNKLKAEIETLKKGSSSSSSSSSSSRPFSDLSSSQRRDLEDDINKDLRGIRANTDFQRNQRFEVKASLNRDTVELELTPYDNWTTDDVKSWNTLIDSSSKARNLEADYEDLVDDVRKELESTLRDYKNYDIEISIYSDTKSSNEVVDASYGYSRDRISVSVSKAK
ncbi:MAG: hypothetical protein ACRC76_00705 [Proteocatella sp.]